VVVKGRVGKRKMVGGDVMGGEQVWIFGRFKYEYKWEWQCVRRKRKDKCSGRAGSAKTQKDG
jgi:hypothetical protein